MDYKFGFLILFAFLSISFLSLNAVAHPAEEWNRTYLDMGWGLSDIAPTVDGGYVLAAYDSIVKIDENGKYLWGKEFSGIGNSVINSISQTEDGDHILVGDTVLIKMDNQSNILWKKAFEKLADGWINSIQQTRDDGYILAGNKGKDVAKDVCLFKIDSAGNEQWNRTFGGNKSDYAYYIQQTADGGYIITGETRSYGSGDFDAWLLKTNTSGIEQWNKTFGGKFQDSTYFVQQTSDGGFILAGSRSYRNYGNEAWLIKSDGNGNLQWIKPFRGSGISSAYSVLMTQDGGFVVSGYTSPYWSDNSDAWLIKVGRGTIGTANTSSVNMNETSSISPTMSLTEVQSTNEKVPAKKSVGFEVTMTITIFLVMKMIRGEKKVIK